MVYLDFDKVDSKHGLANITLGSISILVGTTLNTSAIYNPGDWIKIFILAGICFILVGGWLLLSSIFNLQLKLDKWYIKVMGFLILGLQILGVISFFIAGVIALILI